MTFVSYVDNSVEIGDFFIFFCNFSYKIVRKTVDKLVNQNYLEKFIPIWSMGFSKSFYFYFGLFVLYFSSKSENKTVKRGKENVGL